MKKKHYDGIIKGLKELDHLLAQKEYGYRYLENTQAFDHTCQMRERIDHMFRAMGTENPSRMVYIKTNSHQKAYRKI